jgi:hypothetical protein
MSWVGSGNHFINVMEFVPLINAPLDIDMKNSVVSNEQSLYRPALSDNFGPGIDTPVVYVAWTGLDGAVNLTYSLQSPEGLYFTHNEMSINKITLSDWAIWGPSITKGVHVDDDIILAWTGTDGRVNVLMRKWNGHNEQRITLDHHSSCGPAIWQGPARTIDGSLKHTILLAWVSADVFEKGNLCVAACTDGDLWMLNGSYWVVRADGENKDWREQGFE